MRLIIVPITIAIVLLVCIILAIFFFPNLGEIAQEWNKTKIKFKEGFMQAKSSLFKASSDYFEPKTDTSKPPIKPDSSSPAKGSYQPPASSESSDTPPHPYTPPATSPSQEKPRISVTTR